jgi:hypothetical protein
MKSIANTQVLNKKILNQMNVMILLVGLQSLSVEFKIKMIK